MDRTLLLFKLSKIGISGPVSRVVLNDVSTDWFSCPIGVKQGDTISPTLFAIYINDLAGELNQSGLGIDVRVKQNTHL